jgi:hypothetical protein
VLGTAVNRFEPEGAAAPMPGDLCPVPYSTTYTTLVALAPARGRCTNDAYTGGIDTVLRTDDGAWGAAAQLVGSLVEHGPTRRIPDGTEIGSGTRGWGLSTEVGRYGGEHWLFKAGYSNSRPTLQLNDAGYQDQANFHDGYASVIWRTTTPSKHFLNASLELWFEHRRDWHLDDNLATDPHLTGSVQLTNLWTVSVLASPWYPKWVENRETQDGARTQRPAGHYGLFNVKTDPNRELVVQVSGSVDTRLRGHAWQGSATISLRPVPALELDLIPNVNWSYGAPRWITTVPDDDAGALRYYFSDLDARSFDVTLRGTYAFTRTLSLQAYLQPFVASGHFSHATSARATGARPLLTLDSFAPATLPDGIQPDFRDGAINLNLFARWVYLPLSALWLVYTHNQSQTFYDPMEGTPKLRFDRFSGGPATDVILVKLSYLWF